MIDPIADMLTRIRNASLLGKDELFLPMSKIKLNIAKILEREGFISKVLTISGGEDLKKNQASKFDQIKIVLKYDQYGESKIKSLKRISKPGRRVYLAKNDIKRVLNGLGMAIISTPKGLMTDKEARKNNTGGEIICEIY
jgi:small subunit ribosomal protein S8